MILLGPVRLRQVDDAAHDRRPRGDHRGRSLSSASTGSTTSTRKDRNLAIVFQNYALFPHMTVAGNLGFGMRIRGHARAEIEAGCGEIAAMLGIGELLARKPGELSGGQRQRVALGRALIRDPVAFLLDEPLSNLDAKLRASMRTELIKLHRRLGRTIVHVTHDQVEAMTMGERICIMNGRPHRPGRRADRGLSQPGRHLRRGLSREPADEPSGRPHRVRGATAGCGPWRRLALALTGRRHARLRRLPRSRGHPRHPARGHPRARGSAGLQPIDLQVVALEALGPGDHPGRRACLAGRAGDRRRAWPATSRHRSAACSGSTSIPARSICSTRRPPP